MDLALDNPQWLICFKTKPKQTKQFFFFKAIVKRIVLCAVVSSEKLFQIKKLTKSSFHSKIFLGMKQYDITALS